MPAWKMIGKEIPGTLPTVARMPEPGSRNQSVDACNKKGFTESSVFPGLASQSLLETEDLTLPLSMIISCQSRS